MLGDRAWLRKLLAELCALIAPVFAQARSRLVAFAYVAALLAVAGDRKSCWQLGEQAGHATPRRMQALLAEYAWDWRAVLERLQRFILVHLADPDAILVLDETAELKKGTMTAGVARQHAGITAPPLALISPAHRAVHVRPRTARRRDRTATWHPSTRAAASPQTSTSTSTTDQPRHWRDTGRLPTRPGETPPRDIGLIRITVPEARRLFALFTPTASQVSEIFRDTWSIWPRRHQARARGTTARRDSRPPQPDRQGEHRTALPGNPDCSTGKHRGSREVDHAHIGGHDRGIPPHRDDASHIQQDDHASSHKALTVKGALRPNYQHAWPPLQPGRGPAPRPPTNDSRPGFHPTPAWPSYQEQGEMGGVTVTGRCPNPRMLRSARRTETVKEEVNARETGHNEQRTAVTPPAGALRLREDQRGPSARRASVGGWGWGHCEP